MIGVRVRAVIDTDGLLAAQAVGQYVGIAAFPRLQDALASESFDIVDVCLPPHQQAEAVELALKAGANVLCEKPLTTDSKTAEQLTLLANDRERLLMTGFVHRFHPPVLFLKELVDNDDLGTLVQFRCRFSGLWSEAEAQRTGDILTETAAHGVDLFRYLCGEVKAVVGKIRQVQPTLSVPDTAIVLLEAEQGAWGTVEASWSSPGGHNRIEVYGTAGACIVDYETETLRYLTADHPLWQGRDERGPNRYERMLSHVADAVRGLQPPQISGEDGARVLSLCETIRQQNP